MPADADGLHGLGRSKSARPSTSTPEYLHPDFVRPLTPFPVCVTFGRPQSQSPESPVHVADDVS